MAISKTEIVGEFVDHNGDPIEGVDVKLRLARSLRDSDTGEFYPPETLTTTSGADGQVFGLEVPSNEDPDAEPDDVTYRVSAHFPNGAVLRQHDGTVPVA